MDFFHSDRTVQLGINGCIEALFLLDSYCYRKVSINLKNIKILSCLFTYIGVLHIVKNKTKEHLVIKKVFVASALAGCDIGVRLSSVRPTGRPHFTSTLAN